MMPPNRNGEPADDPSSSSSSSLLSHLRSLDRHTAVSSEFSVRTTPGALLSALTLLSILLLLRSEYAYNLQDRTVVDRVHVNATSPAGLELEFDITFPKIPCALLAVDAADPTGLQAQSLHLDRRHHVWKHRLDRRGKMIGRRSRFELGGTMRNEEHLREAAGRAGLEILEGEALEAQQKRQRLEKQQLGENEESGEEKEGEEPVDEEECGDCYGAGDEGECCPTCDDVKRAYQRRGWHVDIQTIRQCRFQTPSKAEEGEGCNIHGRVQLSTGGGNLHIAPGHNLENFGQRQDMFTSLLDLMTESLETFDVTHTVNQLKFGPDFPGASHQLDGQHRPITDAYAMHQYYLQVVPTEYRHLDGTTIRSNQYSVTEHTRRVAPGSNRGLPGVFFFYEVSALHVQLEEYREGWIRFLTSVCAIVGGVFTVGGMLDRFVHSKMSAIGVGGGSGGGGGGGMRSPSSAGVLG